MLLPLDIDLLGEMEDQTWTSGGSRLDEEVQDSEQPSTSGATRRRLEVEEEAQDNDSPSSTDGSEDDEPSIQRNLYSTEVAAMWNLAKVMEKLNTREKCVAFAEEEGLIKTTKLCGRHRTPMNVVYHTNRTAGSFVCRKGRCLNKGHVSRITGTWFESAKITMPKIFYLMYCFAHKFDTMRVIWEDFTRIEDKCLSQVTVIDWFKHCREVVVKYQLHKLAGKGMIGGPDKVEQIDESKFGIGKRKHNEDEGKSLHT